MEQSSEAGWRGKWRPNHAGSPLARDVCICGRAGREEGTIAGECYRDPVSTALGRKLSP